MKDGTFRTVLFALVAIGAAVTAALLIYAFVLHGQVSLLTYIAHEVW